MNEINVSKIIGAFPIGTQVYSPAYGYCVFKGLEENGLVNLKAILSGDDITLTEDDIIAEGGELMVYPSRYMRDWSKLSWKKGDVLVSNDGGTEVIFDKWYDDTYTSFYGKHCLDSENENNIKYFEGFVCTTERYFIESKDAAQTYINTIEERLGGKLNLETLEIEKQPEFKDGYIVFMKGIEAKLYANCIFILKGEYKDGDERAFYYAFYNADDKFTKAEYGNTKVHYSLRPATDSEKQQLFDALAKKNKAWDAEKKQIVGLPKKCELKPFDKVLVRDRDDERWEIEFFGYYDEDEQNYVVLAGIRWNYCIPYNDSTKHLLGTTEEWKGGEN